MGAQISPVVRPDRNQALPVLFRMHQDRIVLCFSEIKKRFQNLILDLDKL